MLDFFRERAHPATIGACFLGGFAFAEAIQASPHPELLLVLTPAMLALAHWGHAHNRMAIYTGIVTGMLAVVTLTAQPSHTPSLKR